MAWNKIKVCKERDEGPSRLKLRPQFAPYIFVRISFMASASMGRDKARSDHYRDDWWFEDGKRSVAEDGLNSAWTDLKAQSVELQ